MADTERTLSALQTLLANNISGAISAQDLRDFLVSAMLKNVATKTANYTVDADDHLIVIDTGDDNVTITLPTAVGIEGKEYYFKTIW